MANEQDQENWSPTRIGLLRALWDEGLSASAIGQRLLISKNAVIGKVHRLQLTPRLSPIRPHQSGDPTTKTPPRPKAPRPVTQPQAPVTPSQPIALVPVPERASSPAPKPEPGPTIAAPDETRPPALPRPRAQRSCAWPLGDPGTPSFRFCGEDAVPTRPYCEQHCCRAYIRLARQDAVTA